MLLALDMQKFYKIMELIRFFERGKNVGNAVIDVFGFYCFGFDCVSRSYLGYTRRSW